MLRKFKITVNGTEYLVEMEEIGAPQVASVPQPTAPVPAENPEPVVEPTAPAAPVQTSAATADAMTAPMPGTILKILVNPGESVQENQPLMILEAMKMENEIVAGESGVVAGIHVSTGDMVNPGDALITIN
ncbi:acetyl-CoA carboxylase biotin carboxyl carrier protein subunit [Enterococcus durans]|uniref:Acetyl-CoA carboxylase biotin carboxyl carrier protein subunit n=2 Tax=Enterococcus durans TaxID=53345 RepID=A0AB36SB55_9ENTE|nr:acetyl-CoA carboxylase biotin carboxyl carrier protein subunit [Enterococcus durans]EOT33769.1 acetyl-CoA carboxylase biotin carboxyl carrier protein subunit [Enterococcus durans ATCC 6056]EOU25400.1 acetyl-CoA carboxylase biotin carboxyl carrier protein subunit [Enterococcus durans ATCC 6056]MBM1152155.1 acetyl-CoA carboxylase biotin carboxyl carrier protein subunit [Enterococcus durans]MBT9718785.1 acetyl-CoA carboxylase biotin carboxyl carrier protein subunit [Enterococcus durans]PEH4609